MVNDPEIIDVRPEEQLDTARLEPYLREHLPQTDGTFSLRQFGGGHANLTYLASFGGSEYVVRRPPLGPVAAHAHDMKREHRVLCDLYAEFPLAPRSYLVCTDHSILGADFLVEERKHGRAIRRELPEEFHNDATFGANLSEAIIGTLTKLHTIKPASVGLADLGRPEGFLDRQMSGWTQRWEAAETEETTDASRLIKWLQDKLPPSPPATIIHNDYKLDNMLLDASDCTKITAVLDWDMCTLGDPLMDVGYVLTLWSEATDPPAFRAGSMPTWHAGFLTRKQLVERYANRTGTDLTHIHWYHIFNIFRSAAILQQIYKRYVNGQTHDKRFEDFGKQVNALIFIAMSQIKCSS